jgi:hypothetical protein
VSDELGAFDNSQKMPRCSIIGIVGCTLYGGNNKPGGIVLVIVRGAEQESNPIGPLAMRVPSV